MNRQLSRSRNSVALPARPTNRCLLDWFEFTFKVDYRYCDVYDNCLKHFFTCYPEFRRDLHDLGVRREKGALNYNVVFDIGNAYTIFYSSDRYDMGVHVRFPGKAVPLLCGLFNIPCDEVGLSTFKSLLEVVLGRLDRVSGAYIKWSRIDLAFDDFSKKYSPADYIVFQFTNRIRSKCKTSRMAFSNLQQPNIGSTWYLGSRGGNNHNVRFLRVYDKEYESGGLVKAVRYELELRGSYALGVIEEILNDADGSINFGALIQDMFVVLDPLPFKGSSYASMRVAKSRASVNSEWLTLFETQVSRRVKVRVPGRVPIETIPRLVDYLTRMRRPLRMYLDLYGIRALKALCESYNYGDNDKKLIKRLQLESQNILEVV